MKVVLTFDTQTVGPGNYTAAITINTAPDSGPPVLVKSGSYSFTIPPLPNPFRIDITPS